MKTAVKPIRTGFNIREGSIILAKLRAEREAEKAAAGKKAA